MERIKIDKLTDRDTKIKVFLQQYTEYIDKIDNELRIEILNSKAHEICKSTYSAFDVVLVFCFSCVEANKKTNCITEVMFEEAIDIARHLDDHMKLTGTRIGPLHGVPFSIKDTFDIKDFGKSAQIY